MDVYQYNDLPQIPTFTDEPPFAFWSSEHVGHMNAYRQGGVRTSNVFGEDVAYNDVGDNGTLSMQPMQRFLLDPSPLTPGLLHAKLDRGVPLQRQHLRQYEQAWPSAECLGYSPRNGSPDRTSVSGNSSHATQNELRSPHPFHSAPYGSPSDFPQATLPYSSAEHFNERRFPSELPLSGGSISLRELEYEHQEPETAVEEHEHVDLKPDLEYDQEPAYTKVETVPDTYQTYPDSGIGNSLRDAESVQPMTQSDEESSDSDYKPSSNKTKRRRSSTSSNVSGRQNQKRRGHGRKSSTASTFSNSNRVNKKTRASNASLSATKGTNGPSANNGDAQRPFPCPLAAYGCQSNFVSKNEWKRHVSTQHIKLGFWRCDLCTTTVDPHDDQTVYHNDFNRKDLFTQHLRRMHAAPTHQASSTRSPTEYLVNEDNITQHQKRCYQNLRGTPPQAACLFCDRAFTGPNSWEERMEHVGRHLEKDRKAGGVSLDVATWNEDKDLEQWLLDEGLIARDRSGEWKIGDGKPRRHRTIDSEEESDEDE